MRRIALACGLGVTVATTGCGGGSSGSNSRAGAQSNHAPIIAGRTPPDAQAEEFYDFRTDASDPDGDRLVFSISNKPNWAKFNPETGRLYGTPALQEIGIYTGIRIVVSDGHSSTATPEFEIAVTETASDVVTLSWEPPTENEDGSQLRDLAGYRIYLGRDPDRLSRVIVLHNPGLTRYVVEHLRPARWYFAMTSFNRRGRESRRSATIEKLVG